MIVDDVTIQVAAGKGGDGGVYFNRNMMTLGPTGGSGGDGGSVYVVGVSDIGALQKFRYEKELRAKDGHKGKAQLNDGPNGEDAVAQVPVGTVVTVLETGETKEVVSVGERICIAHGGNGGYGNFHFRSPHDTSPKRFNAGLPGEEFTVRLELKMIADVGFVGLPNVGKSSLLNLLTRAKSKVANYQFTTLEPHLGAYYEIILADIPGLIEGASEGKGLGIKFLRHVERTRVLFHFIAADSETPRKDYDTVRAELTAYRKELGEKTEYIIVSRADEVSPEKLEEVEKELRKTGKKVVPLSIYDDSSLEQVKMLLREVIAEKKKLTTGRERERGNEES